MSKSVKTDPRISNVIVEKNPRWLCLDESDEWPRPNILFNVVLFFVLYSPCSQYCTQGRNLQYYGWKKKPWQSNRYLKQKLISAFSTTHPLIKTAKKLDEMSSVLRKAKLNTDDFYADISEEKIAVFHSEASEFMSIFYHIRCALAHGRFAVCFYNDAPVFIMENGISSGNGFQVKARMIIHKKTLDEWIKIITLGPQEDEIDYCFDILNQISKDRHTTIKQMATALNETEYIIRKHLDILKKDGILQYENHGKNGYWEIDYAQKEKFEMSKEIKLAKRITP